jgi:hypothetical protein
MKIENRLGTDTVSNAVVQRSADVMLQAEGREAIKVGLYTLVGGGSDDLFFGRKLLYGNLSLIPGGIVIEEELAWHMFSYTNCIGHDIFINGASYTVSGVYKKNRISKLFTSRDRYEVYVIGNVDESAEAEMVIRNKPGFAPLSFSRFGSLSPVKMVNINSIVRQSVFWSKIIIITALLMILLFIIKSSKIAFFTNHKRKRGFLYAGCALILTILIIFIIVSLKFAPDPRAIPADLISLTDITETIYRWRSLLNNETATGGIYFHESMFLKNTVVVSGIISLCSLYAFLRKIKETPLNK